MTRLIKFDNIIKKNLIDMNTKIIGVMACDPNGLVGSTTAKELPWSYPEDTAFYQNLVKNQPLITGYSTYEKLPSKLLHHQLIIVISAKHQSQHKNHIFFQNIDDFLNSSIFQSQSIFYHLGGGMTMNHFLERQAIDEFYLTEIKKIYSGDVFLDIKKIQSWPKTCIYECNDFEIMHYIRKVPRKLET